MSDNESTGIKDADVFISTAKSLGLDVEVMVTNAAPTYFDNGDVMLPGTQLAMVVVTIPVPDGISPNSVLALEERCRKLLMFWSKRDTSRARGRWTGGNYSSLGSTEDLHVRHRANSMLKIMGEDLNRLKRLASSEN